MHRKIIIFIISCIIILPFKITAQGWVTSSCSGLQMRTAVFCPTDGNTLRIWGDIYELTPGVPTNITEIEDLSGNNYNDTAKLTPTSNIDIIIHSTLNGNNCIDTIKISVANPPQANIIDETEQTLCKNSYINQPRFDTQYVDDMYWEEMVATPTKIMFPFLVTEDVVIRLNYANTACGSGYQHKDITIKIVDTAPVPDLLIKNFPPITNVCNNCYFALPKPEDIKVDSGVILDASINWYIPDSPALQDYTIRYGEATVKLRGDSNLCGYKTTTTTKNIQVTIRTINCDPVIYFNFGTMTGPLDTTMCSCEKFYFGVNKPNNSNAAQKCNYTQTDITTTITPIPTNSIENPSMGDYNFNVSGNFKAFVKVDAGLQCTGSTSHPTVSKTVTDSIEITINDNDCPVPVTYSYCKGDTGYMFFKHTYEKNVDSVTFLTPHTTSFAYDKIRSDKDYLVYKTTEPVLDSTLWAWANVRYTVHYYMPACDDTASYDSTASLSKSSRCEPAITICFPDSCYFNSNTFEYKQRHCSGSPIYITVEEISRATIIDSIVIKDSAEFYTIELLYNTCITQANTENPYGCDVSQITQYVIKAYTKNHQEYTGIDIPIIVYWHDTINGIPGQQSKSSRFIATVNSCDPYIMGPWCPMCKGGLVNIATIGFENPNTNIANAKISFDSTTPYTKVISPLYAMYYSPTTVQYADSVFYKADVTFNVNDSIRYKQFSFSCNIDNCAPTLVSSKDTVCSGDSISIKIFNNNLYQRTRIHHIVWDSTIRDNMDSIESIPARNIGGVTEKEYVLYHTNIYEENPNIICDIYLSVPTVITGKDTLILFRDTLNIFIRQKPSAFIADTIYICQNSTINLHNYEDHSQLTQPPTYALGGDDPAAYTVHDPLLIGVTASCSFHCDWMVGSANLFDDNIFIFVDRNFSLAPVNDEYACIDSVVPLSVRSNGGRLVTWVLNNIDTIAKNIPINQIIYDTVKDISKQYTVTVSNSCNSFSGMAISL